MKNIFIINLLLFFVGCGNPQYRKSSQHQSKTELCGRDSELLMQRMLEKDPIGYDMILDKTSLSREEYLDSCLKDCPFPGAHGNWIPSREGIENSDTVVDGFPYNRV